ncbi:flavin reductase family protein [Actinocatenispora sera]|jgi:flavin reductase (DIM6/NTAB) family NADH-FMN oxidoreductase RutF|uniref:Flavin reductase n=1 Tax=Actinocatenispora sera TaxID=390989 RepID=A0A810KU39_9ACTN|nr:flavin reductase family protein [Actinocatenispora sera]BCJ26753.1 flavin reductase [Actinocatenispora sera]
MEYENSHTPIAPSILYWGTPVVLLSTENPDGTANLAPMSSAFWLGWRGMLGLGAGSQTARNLRRTGECVLNLPSDEQADAVDRLALTTGNACMSAGKSARGYRYQPDKFGVAQLTPAPSDTVAPPRIAECPVAMEATLATTHPIADDNEQERGAIVAFEVVVRRVWVHDEIRDTERADHVDPDAWRPLIMSFQQLYRLGPRARSSRLATIPEQSYRDSEYVPVAT